MFQSSVSLDFSYPSLLYGWRFGLAGIKEEMMNAVDG